MTAKAALCLYLLEGKVLSIANCFKEISLTNPGREIPRMVEKPFQVTVSRVTKESTNRYGNYVSFTQYRLNRTESNMPGIRKMEEYCRKQLGSHPPKTTAENRVKKILDQVTMF
jgi:hypothetical protein